MPVDIASLDAAVKDHNPHQQHQRHDGFHMSRRLRSAPESVRDLRLLGGRLALDFVNTLDPRLGPEATEFLRSPADLILWAAHVRLFDAAASSRVLRQAERDRNGARRALTVALETREAMFKTFASIAVGRPPARTDLAVIERAYRIGLRQAWLRRRGGEFAWTISPDAQLEAPLWAVTRDAVELLTSPLVERVRQCPGLGDCGWLFLDETKNGSRRWCSMEGCGNRVKARRQGARRVLARRSEGT